MPKRLQKSLKATKANLKEWAGISIFTINIVREAAKEYELGKDHIGKTIYFGFGAFICISAAPVFIPIGIAGGVVCLTYGAAHGVYSGCFDLKDHLMKNPIAQVEEASNDESSNVQDSYQTMQEKMQEATPDPELVPSDMTLHVENLSPKESIVPQAEHLNLPKVEQGLGVVPSSCNQPK